MEQETRVCNGRGKGKCCIFYLISTIYMKAKGGTLWEERGTNKGGDWEGCKGCGGQKVRRYNDTYVFSCLYETHFWTLEREAMVWMPERRIKKKKESC